jgi:hypothetical protein
LTVKLTGAPGKEHESQISTPEETPNPSTMASKIKKSAKSAVHNQQALNTPQTSRPKRAIKVTEKARQLLEEKTLVITPKVSKCGKVLPTPDNAGSTQIAKRNPKQGKTSKGPNRCTQGNFSKKSKTTFVLSA